MQQRPNSTGLGARDDRNRFEFRFCSLPCLADQEAWPMNLGRIIFSQLMDFLPLHGVPQVRRPLRRRTSRCGASRVWTSSLHGLRPTDLSREPARHRDLPAHACRPGSTTWAFAAASAAARWPTPTNAATGASMPTSPQVLIAIARPLYADEDFGLRLEASRSTPSIPPPSTCACRCFPGRSSAVARAPSSCTR